MPINSTRNILYSYQSAVDRTPDSYSYGQQIPYIAKHTVTASVKASWKGYELVSGYPMPGRSFIGGITIVFL